MIKHRDIITTPRVQELRRQQKQTRVLYGSIVAIVVIIVIAAFVLLSRLSSLRITNIVVNGVRVLDPVAVEQYFWDEMSGSYMWLLPKQNTFIYPKKHILRTIQQTFPRIETIDIVKNGLNQLQVTITERDGKYLWCGDVFPEPDGSPCYFMDTTGYIFAEAPYFSGTIYFKWYGGKNENNSFIGTTVLEGEGISSLSQFASALKEFGVEPYAIVSKDDNVYELYLKRANDIGPKIILTTKNDLSKTFQNIASAFGSDQMKKIIENNLAGISYIDLRYENKVYYK